MIKVALVSPGVSGGADKMLAKLAKLFESSNEYECIVISPRPGVFKSENPEISKTTVIPGPAANQFHGLANSNGIEFFRKISINAHELSEILTSLEIGLVVSATSTFSEAVLAANLAEIPSITWVQGFVSEGQLGITYSRSQKILEKNLLAASSDIIFVSEWARNFARVRFAHDFGGHVVYNWTDSTSVQQESRTSSEFTIGFFGTLEPHKGFKDIVASISELNSMGRFVQIEVYGHHDFTPELKGFLADKGVTENFIYKGYSVDTIATMSDLDLVVVPSRNESFSLVALEAAFAGKPVIATQVGGLPEVVSDNKTGLLFQPGDAGQLTKHILRLLDDSSVREQMGAMAQERAVQLFGKDAAQSKLESIFTNLIDGYVAKQVTSPIDFLTIIDEFSEDTDTQTSPQMLINEIEASSQKSIRHIRRKANPLKPYVQTSLPRTGFIEFVFQIPTDCWLESFSLDLEMDSWSPEWALGIEIISGSTIAAQSKHQLHGYSPKYRATFKFEPVFLAAQEHVLLRMFGINHPEIKIHSVRKQLFKYELGFFTVSQQTEQQVLSEVLYASQLQ